MTSTRVHFNTPSCTLFVSVQQAAHISTALFQLQKRAKSRFPFPMQILPFTINHYIIHPWKKLRLDQCIKNYYTYSDSDAHNR